MSAASFHPIRTTPALILALGLTGIPSPAPASGDPATDAPPAAKTGFRPAFDPPTENRTLFDPDGGRERYFVETAGGTWEKGTFGCVRTDGRQIHEGIDIRPLRHDGRREALDEVRAIRGGVVVYCNKQPGNSTYGRYLVVQHEQDGLTFHSLYAHLAAIADGVDIGTEVAQSAVLGRLGRSASHGGISRDRAHLHLEIALLLNERYTDWHRKQFGTKRVDHGAWNGRNLAGLDPAAILRGAHLDPEFSLLSFVRTRPALFRVLLVRGRFDFLNRHIQLVRINTTAEREGVAAFEIAFDFNGVPFEIIPRAPSELTSADPIQLIHVNEQEAASGNCRDFLTRRAGRWQLTDKARDHIDLLTF